MKKILIIIIGLFLITGCGSVDKDKVINKFVDEVESSKSYLLKADMEIYNEEDTYSYKVDVSYLDDDYFKVNMSNNTNNHEQIILRDRGSVYVITPSLNKSYKFTSEWPFNSSQAYILNTLVNDIKNDDGIEFVEVDGEYVLKVKVNYPNNSNLSYQKIYFDNNINIIGVDVFNKEDILAIHVKFNKIDMKANLKVKDFDVDALMESDCCDTKQDNKKDEKEKNGTLDNETNEEKDSGSETGEKETGVVDDIIYPLYVPADTYLKEKETVNTENGERVILTFNGAKNFVLIEESSFVNDEFETVPVFGDPLMIADTIGVISSNSLSWTNNNMDYYLTSNDMSGEEILTIANSMNVQEYIGK